MGVRLQGRGRGNRSWAAHRLVDPYGVVRGDGVEVLVRVLELDEPGEEVARDDVRDRACFLNLVQHPLPIKWARCVLGRGGGRSDGGRGAEWCCSSRKERKRWRTWLRSCRHVCTSSSVRTGTPSATLAVFSRPATMHLH
jgi:hypothetical protein